MGKLANSVANALEQTAPHLPEGSWTEEGTREWAQSAARVLRLMTDEEVIKNKLHVKWMSYCEAFMVPVSAR